VVERTFHVVRRREPSVDPGPEVRSSGNAPPWVA
jgi:hypothetical protein